AQYYEQGGQGEQAAKYLIRAGQQALQLGGYPAAQEAFERAYQYTPEDFTLLLGLGETLYYSAGLDAAQPYLKNALAQTTDEVQRVEALAVIGEVYSSDGQYDQARQMLSEALPLARIQAAQAEVNRALLSRVLSGLGSVGWRQGTLEEAETFLQESLDIARDIGHRRDELAALNQLGIVSWLQASRLPAKLDQAESCWQALLTLAQQVGYQEWEMRALSNLATVVEQRPILDRADYRKMSDLFQQALAIAHQLRHATYIAHYNSNLAGAAIYLKDFKQARQYILESMNTALRINAKPDLAMGLVYYARYLGTQGQIEQALAYLGLANNQHEASAVLKAEVTQTLEHLNILPESAEAGMMAGENLEFDTVVREVIAALED
ncbi:MAG: tetratricopeptide repeat protein, partial [Chloroflexota bacterium]